MTHDNLARVGRTILLAAILAVGLVVALGVGTSLAQPGPTPPELGDPVGDNVAPHGGYDASSNFCLQCHAVHRAGSQFALMYQDSVTATCQTCHSIGGSSGTPGTGSGLSSGDLGTASVRAAYTVPEAERLGEHGLGADEVPGERESLIITRSGWTRGGWSGGPTTSSSIPAPPGTASATDGGLYCASCHTPHGDFGQVVNKWTIDREGTTVIIGTATRWLDYDGAAGAWKLCTTAGAVVPGDGSGDCPWALKNDLKGNASSLYGYKLLSAYPNHTYGAPARTWGTTMRDSDTTAWCATCHESRPRNTSTAYINHGSTCLACHSTPEKQGSTDKDFPHTSTVGALLKDYPDALCISCHTPGTLP